MPLAPISFWVLSKSFPEQCEPNDVRSAVPVMMSTMLIAGVPVLPVIVIVQSL